MERFELTDVRDTDLVSGYRTRMMPCAYGEWVRFNDVEDIKAQVAHTYALLQRVSLKCDAANCTLENPCVGCAVGIELMRCGSDGMRKSI